MKQSSHGHGSRYDNDGCGNHLDRIRDRAPICTPASVEPEQQTRSCFDMTLRDYFAAKAVAALIAEPMWNEMQVAMVLKIGRKPLAGAELYASAAYALADAMLEARKK